MKIAAHLFLLSVTVIAAIWIGSQLRSIEALEEENARLANALSARTVKFSARRNRHAVASTTLDRKPVDWHAVAREIATGRGSGYLQTNLRLEEAFRSLSKDELLAALDEIDSAGLTEEDRERLERKLASLLALNYPEAAMRRFVDRSPNTLHEWAKADPKGAIAWFDEQIAAGAFDSQHLNGRMHKRVRFEAALVGVLLSHDPEAASRRFEALPELERMKVIRDHSFLYKLDSGQHAAWAGLLREHLSEEDRLDAVTWPVSEKSALGETGTVTYQEFDAYLARIEASPVERDACILAVAAGTRFERASGNYFETAPEDMDALRAWVTSRAPELVEEATGRAIEGLLRHGNYPKVTEIALHSVEAGASEQVLYPLLDISYASQHEQLAHSVAEMVSDQERRERFLEALDHRLAQP